MTKLTAMSNGLRCWISVVAVATAAGCNQLPPVPPIAPAEPPRQFDQPHAATGPAAFALTGGRAATVYWVLGALGEYQGRQVVGDGGDAVELFYCNETRLLNRFRRVLARLAFEQGLDNDRRETALQDCLVTFHSTSIAWAVNSMYRDRRTTGFFDGPISSGRERVALRISDQVFEGTGRDTLLAYLAGVYWRFGQGEVIAFANAEHKADLVASLLRQVGATDVRRDSRRDTIPHGNAVYFKAPAALMKALTSDEP